jgi:Protein of unknown function (DUF2865).
MRGSISKLVIAAAAASLCGGVVFAQQASQNPTCQKLEAQLTSLDRGNADPQRAEQIRRAEDAVNRQQFEVDRLVSESRRMGCQSSGFFSIFSNPPPQCGGLNRRIGQERSTLEHMQNGLERLNGGTTERAAQRQSLLIALGDNGCGPQYRSAAIAGQQRGFFDRLFGGSGGGDGGDTISTTPNGPMGGNYRTICVRTCDGYYFPVSFSTTPDRFQEDAQTCQRMCPAAEVQLYTYHNPGEDVSQAVSLSGQPYTALPTAFQYRKTLNQACSCRRAGESWYEALKGNGPDGTVAPGDVIVTEQNAKRLSQPRVGADGKPIRQNAQPPAKGAQPKSKSAVSAEPALGEAPGEPDPAKRSVRTVGPTFLPKR